MSYSKMTKKELIIKIEYFNELETRFDEVVTDISILKASGDYMKRENEKLTEKLDIQYEAVKNYRTIQKLLMDRIVEHECENEKLKEALEHYKQKFIKERDENRKISMIQLKEIHYKQMEEENEKLKKEKENWKGEYWGLRKKVDWGSMEKYWETI